MVAAALGRTREEPVDDLAALEFGVRADQPGILMADYQISKFKSPKSKNKSKSSQKDTTISYRYYLADAKFLAALSGDTEMLSVIDEALRSPRWPLYLGRRSCPPDVPVSLGVRANYHDVREALSSEPWIAFDNYRHRHQGLKELEVSCDAREGEPAAFQEDIPLSFSGEGRRYASRGVYRYRVNINPGAVDERNNDPTAFPGNHDPMGFY
jgi:CRISPR system Cascade subunit CasD